MTAPRVRPSRHPLVPRRCQPWWVNWIIVNADAIQLAVIGLALVPLGWAALVAALRAAAWWNA